MSNRAPRHSARFRIRFGSAADLYAALAGFGSYFVLGALAFVAACTDARTPTSPTSNFNFGATGARLAVGSKVTYHGAPYSAPINYIRLRVYDESNNALLGKLDQFLDPQKSSFDFDFAVDLGGRNVTAKTTMELANRDAATGVETVEYSGRVARSPLKPGDFRQLDIELFPGPLNNLDVTGVTLTKPIPTQTEGDKVQAVATIAGPSDGVKMFWSSLDANIATVSSTGLVTTLLPGNARIVVAVGAFADTVTVPVKQRLVGVTITPNPITVLRGDSLNVVGRGVDPRGGTIAGEAVTWSISNEGNATLVSPGRIAGVRLGSATLTATSVTNPTLKATAPVTVGPPLVPVASITVTPNPALASAIGATTTFTAVAKNAAGAVMPGITFQWATGDATIATVNSSGVATATGAGTTTVRAFVEEASGTATLVVRPPGMSITAVSGNGQSGTVKTAGQPVVAKITDAGGKAIAGVDVTFASTDVGAVVNPTTTVTTDANGLATAAWSFGTKAGTQTVTATSLGMNNSPLAFTATVLAGPAKSLVQITAPSSSAANRTPFAQQPVFELQDEFGNPVKVAGTTVTAAITSGGGTLTNATATTDANGRVTFSGLTLSGTVGARTISFTATGIPAVTANVTLTAGPATTVTVVSAGGTATAGGELSPGPKVKVTDADGNPVPNATVTVAVTAGGGTLTTTTFTTDPDGLATISGWKLGPTQGPNTISISTPGVTPPTSLTVNSAPGAASLATSTIAASPTSLIANGTSTSTITVQLKDAGGNNLTTSGGTVTLSTTLGTLSAVTNNNNGTYTATLTAPTSVGTAQVTASLGGAALTNASNPVSISFSNGAATQIALSGGSTTGAVNAPLAVPPSVIVRDANNNPVSGVSVTFAVATGGGSITGATQTTNSSGIATLGSWTLGPLVGANTLTATSGTLSGSPLTIAATATATAATQMALNGGSTTGTVGQAVATAPSVIVKDASGNPVAGVQVSFSVASGGGSITGANQVTNSSGIAAVTSWTLGTVAGANSITATSAGLTNSPLTITATAAAGAATKLTYNGGSTSGSAGQPVAVPPSVIVRDQYDNPVSGVSVTFAIGTGGGSVTGGSATTNANGVATVGSWVLGATVGTNTLTVTSAGLSGSPLTITATSATSTATQMALNGGSTTGVAGSAVATAPSVIVKDANGNPVSGVLVNFTPADAKSGSVTGGTATTNAQGVATVTSWTLGNAPGTQSLIATSTGLTGSPLTISVTASAAAATQIAAAGGSNSGTVGAVVASAPSVIVRDAVGNPVAGVSVTFAVTAGGGSGTSLTQTTNSNGIATVGSWTLGTVVGTNTMTATSTGLTGSPVTFTVQSSADAPAKLVIKTSAAGSTAGAAFTTQPQITVQDQYGNTVTVDNSTVVTMTVSSGGTVVGTATATAVNGIATFSNVGIGGTAGTYTLTFAKSGLTPATQSITSVSGAATQMALNGGSTTGAAGAALAVPPSVIVRDVNNNPVSGVSVTFAVATGGGSITGATQTTNSSGIATVGSWTLGSVVGANTLTATSGTLAGSPLTIAATGTTTAATQMALNGGSTTGTVGQAVATAPSVIVKDASGNPVAGVAVSFAVASGSGSVTGANQVTNSAGIATVGSWTLGTVAGANSLTATSAGLTNSPLTISATAAAGAATKLTYNGGSTSGSAGQPVAVPPSVIVRDQYDNPVSGVSVTFAIGTGGGSITGGAATTNASGIATVGSWTLGATVGTNTLTVTSTGLTGSPLTITATSAVTAATQMALNGGSTTGVAGSAVATAPSVIVKDVNGNPVSGVLVNFTPTNASSGSVTGGTATTNASGVATVGSWTLGNAPGSQSLTATSTGLTGSPLTISVTASAAAATQIAAAGGSNSGTVGAVVASAPSVIVRDAVGNPVAGVTVTFAVTAGGGSGTSLTQTTNSNGIATVGSWTLGTIVGTNTMTASATGLTGSPVTFTAQSSADAAAKLAIKTSAAGAASGAAFTTQPQITVQDQYGNTVTADNSTVITISVGSGASVIGAATATSSSGIASYSTAGLSGTVGTYTLTYAKSGLTSVTQSITLTYGSATQLGLSTTASGSTSGAAFSVQPVVAVRDASGNTVTNDNSSVVTMTVSAGGTVVGTATATASSGLAIFTTVGISGTNGTQYTLTFAKSGLTSVTQAITPGTGAASQLVQTTNAAGAASGAAFTTQPAVAIRDASGNTLTDDNTTVVTMTVSTGGTVVGVATATAVAGVATFSTVGISGTIGTYTLTFSKSGLTSTTQSITLGYGAASQLALTTNAAGAVSGAAFTTQPVVEIRDGAGNKVANSSLVITMTVNNGGTVVGTATATAASGVATFSTVGISGVAGGNYTLTYATGSLTSVTQSISPVAGSASQLALTTNASGATSGSAFTTQPVVELRDANGNKVSGDNSSIVTMTVSSGGTVVGTATATASAGVATFSTVGISGIVGNYSLTFAKSGLTSATQSLSLAYGTASQLALSTNAAGAVSGSAFTTQPVVEIRDGAGNKVTNDNGSVVTMTVSAGATVVGTATATASAGVATFSTVGISGTSGTSYTLTFAKSGLTSATQSITPSAGSASQLALTTSAAGAASGSAFTTQPVVEIRDASGNKVSSDNSSIVTMTVSAGGTIVGTATATSTGGVATFSTVGLSGTIGSYTLTFAKSGLTSATQSITLGYGSASQLALTTNAAGSVSGSAFTTQPVVEIRDGSANKVANDNSTIVTMTVSSGGTVVGTATATASSGVATFSTVGISGTAGTSYTLTFAKSGLTSATQTITPTAGSASQLALTTNAAGSASGAAFTTQPVVEIRDASGNKVSTDNGSIVTMTVSAGGTVIGTATATASSGVATFSTVGISGTAGTSYTLTFAKSGLTSATQSITPTYGTATQLALTTNAAGAASGAAFTTQPVVEIRDGAGNKVANDNSSIVTMTVSSGGTVVGTATATASSGVATFSTVGISGTAGTSYTLTFAKSGLTSATQSITPTFGTASQLGLSTTASGSTSGAAFSVQPVVAVRDASGNTVTNDNSSIVTMTVSAGGTVVGTATATASSGLATFSTVGISGTNGTQYTLTFAKSGLTSVTQTITPGTGAASQLVQTTNAAGAASGAAFTTQPVIAIRDGSGNTLTDDNTTVVTMTVSAGGTVVGTATATASSGVATFSTVGISGTIGTYTLTFSKSGLTSATQSITLTYGAASQLALTTSAAGSVSGSAFTTQPVVEIRDAAGNKVANSALVVTMTVSSGGTVVGTATATAASGVATFSTVGISGTAGTSYTLTFATGSLTNVTQSITPSAGSGTQLALTTNAAGSASGSAFTTQPVVEIRDASGNKVSSDNSTIVTMTVSAGGTVIGTATATASSGVATFSTVGISGTAGTSYTLTFAKSGLTSATQSITPTYGAASQLALTTNAAGSASGAAFTTQPVVEIRDGAGNKVSNDNASIVTMTVSAGGTVIGTATATASAGVATFSTVGISGTAGTSYTLTFARSGLTSATQSITPTYGTASQLALTTNAAGSVSGSAFTTQPVVEIRDASGNKVANSSVIVTMTVSAGGTVVGTATATAASGVATFSTVGISGTAGTSYTLTFASGSLTSATQSITPTAGSASQLALTTSAAGSVSGAAFTTQPVVEIRDASGNKVSTDNSTIVTMTVSVGGTVVGTATATASAGVVTFSTVGISGTAGTSYTLTFAKSGLTSATQSITPTYGSASQLALTTNAATAASGAAFGTQPVVEIRDAIGNKVANDNATIVTMTVSSGGTVVGTATATASSGVATFSTVGISGVAGNYTLTFAKSSLTSATQAITLTYGAASQLALSTNAAGSVSGAAFTTQPVVEVRDAQGNKVANDNSSIVTMTVSAGGTVVGTATATASSGVATFSTVGISGTAGTSYTLTFAKSGLTSATQSITPTTGTATQLALTTNAAGAASGAAFTTQPVVEIRDGAGNKVSTDNASIVTMTVSAGGTVVGTATATASAGVATFSTVGISGTAGTSYTLTFAKSGLTSATQSITPTYGAASQLALTTNAAGSVSGSAFTTQPVVEIRDASGNKVANSALVITMTVSAGGTVVGTATASASSGVATFSTVGISGTAGTSYTLTFATGSLTSVTQSITPTFGTATQLAITTTASGATSGSAFTTQPVVAIRDATGNTVTNDNSSIVTMTVSAGGTVVGTATATASSGVATFSTVGITGTNGTQYTLTFSKSGLTSATQTITPGTGASTQLVLTTNAAGAASGAAFTTQPVVAVRDASGNTATDDNTTVVTMTVSAGGTVVGTATKTVSSGVATFSTVGISGTAATYTLTFSKSGLTSATQNITLTYGAATQLALTTNAAGSASGAAFTTQPVVEIRDGAGNKVANDNSSIVTMTVSAGGTVVGTATATASSGVATFSTVGISGTAGTTYTLTFAKSGLTSATQSITPTYGAASQLALTTNAAGSVSGSAFTTQPVVEIRDAQGNKVANSALVVTMTVSAGGTVVGTATATAASGVATFSTVGISGTAGTAYTLTFATGSLTSVTQSITPSAGAASQLALTTNAATAASGAAFGTQPVVEIRDASGNKVSTDNSTIVTMTVSAGGTVVGTATATASSGIATFSTVGISGTAATYTLTFAKSGLTSATQSITLTYGAASQLALTTNAATAASGAAFGTQPVVEIRDAQGNKVANSSLVITMTVSAGGTVVGTATATAASGVATFSTVGISGTAGTSYTLTFATGSLTSVTQSITPSAGAASQLAVTTNAATAASGAAFGTQPVVAIRDASGNTVTTDNSTIVTMTVSAGGTVVGTATATASSGVATFSTVGISGTAATYTLTFAKSGLTSATQSIALTAGTASQLVLTTNAATAASGAAFGTQPVVAIRDAQGNTVTTDNSSVVTMTVSAGGTVVGTATATASSGVATFSTVGLSGTAATYTLTFAKSGLTSATQSIALTYGAASQLVLTTSAATASNGAAFGTQPVVAIRDAAGNTVTSSSAIVTMTVSSGATVVGTATATASSGVATFSTVGISGTVGTSYTLTFASGSLNNATQSITAAVGAASKLTLTTNAAGAQSGNAFTTQPVVAVQDAGGNTITSDNTTVVTFSVSAGSTVGTVTKTVVNGVATFTGIGITGTAGTSYTLTFAKSGLTSATQSITLSGGTASKLVTSTAAAGAVYGTAFTTQPVIAIQDASSNTVTVDNSTIVTMTVSAGGTLSGTLTATAVNGLATFSGVSLTGTTGSSYTLTFSKSGLASVTQSLTLTATVPGAPTNLANSFLQTDSTSHTDTLSWTAPTNNGGSAITDYVIEYKKEADASYTVFSHTASTSVSAIITGLAVKTAYMFRVAAKNAIGTGAYSSIKYDTTTGPSERLACSTPGTGNSSASSASIAGCGASSTGTLYLVPVIVNSTAAADSVIPPSGWTRVGTNKVSASSQLAVFYKYTTTTNDVATATFTWSTNVKSVITLVAYKNVTGTPAMSTNSGSGATITSPTVSAPGVSTFTNVYIFSPTGNMGGTSPTLDQWRVTNDLFKNTNAGANNVNNPAVLTADVDRFSNSAQTAKTATAYNGATALANDWLAAVLTIKP